MEGELIKSFSKENKKMNALKFYSIQHKKLKKISWPLPDNTFPGLYQVKNPIGFKKEMIRIHGDGYITGCLVSENNKVQISAPKHHEVYYGNINFDNVDIGGIRLFLKEIKDEV